MDECIIKTPELITQKKARQAITILQVRVPGWVGARKHAFSKAAEGASLLWLVVGAFVLVACMFPVNTRDCVCVCVRMCVCTCIGVQARLQAPDLSTLVLHTFPSCTEESIKREATLVRVKVCTTVAC
eukprot:1158257-Pelagomonas_calceolata.AAC.6